MGFPRIVKDIRMTQHHTIGFEPYTARSSVLCAPRAFVYLLNLCRRLLACLVITYSLRVFVLSSDQRAPPGVLMSQGRFLEHLLSIFPDLYKLNKSIATSCMPEEDATIVTRQVLLSRGHLEREKNGSPTSRCPKWSKVKVRASPFPCLPRRHERNRASFRLP